MGGSEGTASYISLRLQMEERGQLHVLAALPKEKWIPVPTRQEAEDGWASESVQCWVGGKGERLFSCWKSNPDSLFIHPVSSHYTNCDIPAPQYFLQFMRQSSSTNYISITYILQLICESDQLFEILSHVFLKLKTIISLNSRIQN